MATAARWTIRQEPYDPDARDADNDGIVQEGTPWERPAGTRLVDEIGRAITRGANANARPRGLRVVDRQGNDVAYTATYDLPGGKITGGGTPLMEAGAMSLRERGLPSVRDITAPRLSPLGDVDGTPDLPLPDNVIPSEKPSAEVMRESADIAASMQAAVEERFGPLRTRWEIEAALKEVYPNTNFEALIQSASGSFDEQVPSVVAVRNYTHALLFMGMENPDVAKRIRSINGMRTDNVNHGGQHAWGADVTRGGEFIDWYINLNQNLDVNLLDMEARGDKGEPWAYRLAISMKESGDFSDGEINQMLHHSVAIHEFAHAMHVQAGLAHWGSADQDRISAEVAALAYAKFRGLSPSDSMEDLQYFISREDYDPDLSEDEKIFKAIAHLLPNDRDELLRYQNGIADVIRWDGVTRDAETRDQIRGDLGQASGYANDGFDSNPETQYSEGMAETITRQLLSGTSPGTSGETSAHVRTLFQDHGAPDSSGALGGKGTAGQQCSGYLELGPDGKFGPVSTSNVGVDTPTDVTGSRISPDGIEKKNKQVLDGIRASGGEFARVSPEYVEDHEDKFQVAPVLTSDSWKEAREEQAKYFFSMFQLMINDPEAFDRAAEENPALSDRKNLYKGAVETLHPDLVEKIRTTSPEDLIAEVNQLALDFHEGIDPRVRLRVPTGRIESMLGDGRYKTAHEVVSEHSQSPIRSIYEQSIGIPLEAPAEVRPASAYVVHKDLLDAAIERIRLNEGREPTEFDDPRYRAGVLQYGDIELILRPEVSGRTAYGRGDTLTNSGRVARFGDATEEEKINAALHQGGKFQGQSYVPYLGFLEAGRTGKFDRVFEQDDKNYNPDAGNDPEFYKIPSRGSAYYEALVAGSFSVDEIEEAVIPSRVRDTFASQREIMGKPRDEAVKDVLDEFYSDDALRSAGLTDDEIKYLTDNDLLPKWMEGAGWDAVPSTPGKMLGLRHTKHIEDELKKAGVLRVRHTDSSGRDVMDLANYRDAGDARTVDELLARRYREEVVRSLREAMDKHKNSKGGTQSSDW